MPYSNGMQQALSAFCKECGCSCGDTDCPMNHLCSPGGDGSKASSPSGIWMSGIRAGSGGSHSKPEEYIKYSVRYGVTDPDLAGLLDYIERVIGWDIHIEEITEHNVCMAFGPIQVMIYKDTNFISIRESYRTFDDFIDMDLSIFYGSYKTLLPLIRDKWPRVKKS